MAPLPLRQQAWKRLESDLDRQKLATIITEIAFSQVLETAPRLLDGGVRGRIVVKIG
jgi:acrylyl-CoA reductase (NADPH)